MYRDCRCLCSLWATGCQLFVQSVSHLLSAVFAVCEPLAVSCLCSLWATCCQLFVQSVSHLLSAVCAVCEPPAVSCLCSLWATCCQLFLQSVSHWLSAVCAVCEPLAISCLCSLWATCCQLFVQSVSHWLSAVCAVCDPAKDPCDGQDSCAWRYQSASETRKWVLADPCRRPLALSVVKTVDGVCWRGRRRSDCLFLFLLIGRCVEHGDSYLRSASFCGEKDVFVLDVSCGCLRTMDWDSTVWGRHFPHPSWPSLGPTQPPIQLVPALFPGGKASGAWH
jgi:hypothetical protein